MTTRIAIIGAGPIGIEAALAARRAGFDSVVYERGRAAANVRDWGHVRLFSPFSMNASEAGRAALGEAAPADDEALTGREYVERYLLPLSRLPALEGRIRERTRVVAIGRNRLWKGDLIGRPERLGDPFRLLLDNEGREAVEHADYVFDCSGTYGNPNWIGAGGAPCIGERQLLDPEDYRVPDLLGRDRDHFLGRTTLVVGAGYSAATAVVALEKLNHADPKTRAVWVTRSDRSPPIARIDNDPLGERDALAAAANRLAVGRNPIDWRPGTVIERIDVRGGRLRISLSGGDEGENNAEVIVDRVIAHTGYRPDRSLYEELQVHECYASQGPIKLAAALLGESGGDCLTQQGHGAEALRNPEPGFFILGAKSYGRDSRFLIRIGLEQIRDVLEAVQFDVRHG